MLPEFYHSHSGNSLRAAIAVELSGVDVERHYLNLKQQEHKSASYLKVNPAGTVPAYVEEIGQERRILRLTQSGAILKYLIAKHRPELIPEDLVERSQVNSIVFNAISDIAVQNALLGYMSFEKKNVAFLSGRLLYSIQAAFIPITQSDFFGGNEPSIADYAHFPVIYMRENFIRSVGSLSHIIDWMERMMRINAVSRSIGYSGLQVPLN